MRPAWHAHRGWLQSDYQRGGLLFVSCEIRRSLLTAVGFLGLACRDHPVNSAVLLFAHGWRRSTR